MGNYKNVGNYKPTGTWEQIADYEATSAEGTKTLSFTAVDYNDHSMIVLVLDASVTLSLSVLMRINAIANANYYQDANYVADGTATVDDISAATQFTIANSAVFGAVDECGSTIVIIKLNKGGANQYPTISIEAQSGFDDHRYVGGGNLKEDVASISSLVVYTNTSTWKIGARMTVYKVAR